MARKNKLSAARILQLFILLIVCAIGTFVWKKQEKKVSPKQITSASFLNGNRTIDSFQDAKKLLKNEVFYDHRTTFYCGCSYDENKVQWSSCGYRPKDDKKRASRIEWEHVVPASLFGRSFAEWKGSPDCVNAQGNSFKGRKCAEKASPQFRLIEADMYNLFPAIGEVNADRRDYPYGEIPGEKREYGACDFEVDGERAEPREAIRGIIARTYLYMDYAYPGLGIIKPEQQSMFDAWNKEYPPDNWECERAKRIKEIQKNDNPVAVKGCAGKR